MKVHVNLPGNSAPKGNKRDIFHGDLVTAQFKPDTMHPTDQALFDRVPAAKQLKLVDEVADWLDTVFDEDPPSPQVILEKIAAAVGVEISYNDASPHDVDGMRHLLANERAAAAQHRRQPRRTIAAVIDLLNRTGPQS